MWDVFGIFSLFYLAFELFCKILEAVLWVFCILGRVVVELMFFWVPRK